MVSKRARGAGENVLLVHAHPDDETISTGGAIARFADAGVRVTVLTCTRGERGEVIPAHLAHLEGDHQALARHREGELAAALQALGAKGVFLGDAGARLPGLAPRRYTDSGMVWGPDGRPQPVPDVASDALCSAEFGEVVADVASAIRSTGATVVVSYDELGGYGHPDHVYAHRAARAAAASAGVDFYEIVEDAEQLELLAQLSDDERGVVFDVSDQLDAKVKALRAHETQVRVIDEGQGGPVLFALSSGPARPVATREGFRLRDAPRRDDNGVDSGAPEPATRSSWVSSVAVSLIVGVLVGILLTINHQHALQIGDVSVPLGLIAAIAITAALIVGMRIVFTTRIPAIAASAGIVLSTVVLSQRGPGGSVLVPGNTAGYVWAYAPAIIALLVLLWPKLPATDGARMDAQTTTKGTP